MSDDQLNRIQLAPHFKLREFTRSGTADRHGLDNNPSICVMDNLRTLCTDVLEPVRRYYNRPVQITSGYRSEQVNKLIDGAAPDSYHTQGKAADFVVHGVPNQVVFMNLYHSALPITELIYYEEGWIHVAHDPSKVDHMEVYYTPEGRGATLFTDQINIYGG